MTQFDPICEKCEELIQPYLDRELSDSERLEAEQHLTGCGYWQALPEVSLRRYVRQACCSEQMSPELKAKLARSAPRSSRERSSPRLADDDDEAVGSSPPGRAGNADAELVGEALRVASAGG